MQLSDNEYTAEPVKKGALVIIHGLVMHKSYPNRSEDSRHAYTFHVVDFEKGNDWSKENWLRKSDKVPFQNIYEVPS